jgi:hypothetical protein
MIGTDKRGIEQWRGELVQEERSSENKGEGCSNQEHDIHQIRGRRLERYPIGRWMGVNELGSTCNVISGNSPLEARTLILHGSFDQPEEIPAVLRIPRIPELLEDLERVQDLRFRVFKPALQTPNGSLCIHRRSQRVHIIDGV